ncbi:MAG: hypothetical protein IJM36_00940 [Acholeplasmatales bacterium]|nr:hypothetical protein [Acholeplasmatales bacterium]
MYVYLKGKITKQLREYVEDIIKAVQKEIKPIFTFDCKLIGSGSSSLITINPKQPSYDLDYNIILQKDKKGLLNNPRKIKELFFNKFKECGNGFIDVIENSKSVITCKTTKSFDLYFSFDIAIMYEENDGFLYKIIFDKPKQAYYWNKVKNSNQFEQKFLILKRSGYFQEIKELYLNKKNTINNKSSFSLLIEVVNELWNKYGYK